MGLKLGSGPIPGKLAGSGYRGRYPIGPLVEDSVWFLASKLKKSGFVIVLPLGVGLGGIRIGSLASTVTERTYYVALRVPLTKKVGLEISSSQTWKSLASKSWYQARPPLSVASTLPSSQGRKFFSSWLLGIALRETGEALGVSPPIGLIPSAPKLRCVRLRHLAVRCLLSCQSYLRIAD
jgi:hypothetical protein